MKYIKPEIMIYAKDIVSSEGMQSEKNYVQHGNISCFEHSVRVASMSITMVSLFHIKVDMKSLVRGALLHDYFLYDWHMKEKIRRHHGFIHARRALENADRDFTLNDIERDIIEKHMFPLNIKAPKYRESIVICITDKLSAIIEFGSHIHTIKNFFCNRFYRRS